MTSHNGHLLHIQGEAISDCCGAHHDLIFLDESYNPWAPVREAGFPRLKDCGFRIIARHLRHSITKWSSSYLPSAVGLHCTWQIKLFWWSMWKITSEKIPVSIQISEGTFLCGDKLSSTNRKSRLPGCGKGRIILPQFSLTSAKTNCKAAFWFVTLD